MRIRAGTVSGRRIVLPPEEVLGYRRHSLKLSRHAARNTPKRDPEGPPFCRVIELNEWSAEAS